MVHSLLSVLLAVFSISVITGFKIHTFCKCSTPRSKTQQSSPQRKLWPQDLWLWTRKNHLRDWFHDRICCDTLVPSAWTASKLLRIYRCYRYLVCRLHIRGDYPKRTSVSWKRPCWAVATYNRGMLIHSCFHRHFRWSQSHLYGLWSAGRKKRKKEPCQSAIGSAL